MTIDNVTDEPIAFCYHTLDAARRELRAQADAVRDTGGTWYILRMDGGDSYLVATTAFVRDLPDGYTAIAMVAMPYPPDAPTNYPWSD